MESERESLIVKNVAVDNYRILSHNMLNDSILYLANKEQMIIIFIVFRHI